MFCLIKLAALRGDLGIDQGRHEYVETLDLAILAGQRICPGTVLGGTADAAKFYVCHGMQKFRPDHWINRILLLSVAIGRHRVFDGSIKFTHHESRIAHAVECRRDHWRLFLGHVLAEIPRQINTVIEAIHRRIGDGLNQFAKVDQCLSPTGVNFPGLIILVPELHQQGFSEFLGVIGVSGECAGPGPTQTNFRPSPVVALWQPASPFKQCVVIPLNLRHGQGTIANQVGSLYELARIQ